MSTPSDKGGISGVIARIECDLRELWLVPGDRQSMPPTSRVCTMNLIVVADQADLLDRYTPIVDEVSRSTPARTILVSVEPDAPDELMGDAEAVRSLDPSHAVCSERVRLYARGAATASVASCVDALLVPEIPTALVWLGRIHAKDPIFEAIAGAAHRIITDTEYTSLVSLVHLASWARAEPDRPFVADLAWTRLSPWLELFARFFDDKRLHNHAQHLTRLRINQASDKGARLGSEAALLIGWIGTRLGLRTSRLGGSLRFQRADGRNVAVEFGSVPRPEGVAPATLAQVFIDADFEGVTLRGSLERNLGSGLEGSTVDNDVVKWTLQVADAPAIEQQVRLGTNKGAKWLERTLHRPAKDPALVEAVAFAEEVVEDGLFCG